MILPTIHTNGTGVEDLIAQALNARRAVYDAITALAEAAPNGRDYYPQGEAVLSVALADHRCRMSRLVAIAGDMLELAEYCQQFVKK